MLRLGTYPLEQVSVPVEIAEVEVGVGVCHVGNDPWTCGVLGHIVPAVIHHLDLRLRKCPGVVALEYLVERVRHGDVVVRGGYEVRRGGVAGDGVAAIVVDGCPAFLANAALGVDQNHARGSLCTVDGAGGGVLKHGDALDVSRVHERQAALHAVHQHKRAAGVQGNLSSDGHAVFGSFDGTVSVSEDDGRIRTLEGHCRISDGTLVERRAVDYGNGTGHIHLFLGTVTHHHDFVEQVHRIVEFDFDMAFVAINSDLLVGITDVGNDEGRGEFDVLERKTSVGAGDKSKICTLDEYTGSHKRIPVLIQHNAGDLSGFCLRFAFADGNALPVDDVGHLLACENLVQHVRNRCSGSVDANYLVEVHVARINGYRVSVGSVQCGNSIANLHILQRQINLSTRADAEHQSSECQNKWLEKAFFG